MTEELIRILHEISILQAERRRNWRSRFPKSERLEAAHLDRIAFLRSKLSPNGRVAELEETPTGARRQFGDSSRVPVGITQWP